MKYKKECLITCVIILLILFLKMINVFQIENGLGKPLICILMIIVFSSLTIFVQRKIDFHFEQKEINYSNLDILKYICAILIIVLHLRPFLNVSNELDLAFNNIITRICVPIFFLITGFFVAKKDSVNPDYIKSYVKRMIPLYLVWSAFYIPFIIKLSFENGTMIQDIIQKMNLSFPIILLLSPLVLLVMLLYSGLYYHLWYFPAVMLSLLILYYWKKKFSIHSLLIISFFLLLIGATETYYGVLPTYIQEFLSLYYRVFYTTRNFLFFGLFYVVLGYFMGSKKELYSKYSFLKLIVCVFFLIFEAILLHDTKRLNSNILLFCIPLVYYLFVSVIYFSKEKKWKFPFRNLSKYYYLVHPAMIVICFFIFKRFHLEFNPYVQVAFVLGCTHFVSLLILKIKKRYPKLVL